MNLLKNFLSKYWLFIILAIIVGFLSGFYLINRLKVTEKRSNLLSLPQTKFDSYPIKNDLNYNFILKEDSFDLEKNQTVYDIDYPSLNDQEALLIAKKFDFDKIPNVFSDQRTKDMLYKWEDGQKSLSINLTKWKIDYLNFSLIQTTDQFNQITSEKIEEIAIDFVKKNDFYPLENINLVFDKKSKINLVEIDENLNATQIIFKYQINNKDILGPKVEFLIAENGEILKFSFDFLFKTIKPLEKYPLKNKEEILNELKNYKIINYFDTIDNYSSFEDINNIININLNKIKLVYLKTETPQSYLQPFFFISGQALLNNENQAEVGLYLPAVKNEYLLR